MASWLPWLSMGPVVLASIVSGVLVRPAIPPRGFNSFDLQFDKSSGATPGIIPVWNETEFRRIAKAQAEQLLPYGYDIIVIDGGWSGGNIDANGRPYPSVEQWPSASNGTGFKPLADFAHSLGLKFGIWTLRGVNPVGVARKLPIKGTNITLDQVAYGKDCSVSADPNVRRWCNCTWDQNGMGLNASHPAAAVFYTGLVELYASWGVDLIKWDCMYDGIAASYAREEELAVNAVETVDRPMVLSLSPGGGMTPAAAAWVAGVPSGQQPAGGPSPITPTRASMYRVTGDFHALVKTKVLWVEGLPEHVFTVGNLSWSADGPGHGLIGVNKTWPDQDIVDLGKYSEYFGLPQAKLHATIWMMARSPLMYGGSLPITDSWTLNLVTNKLALMINEKSDQLRVSYQGDCRCKAAYSGNSCVLINGPGSDSNPCIATWYSSLGKCTAVAVLNIGNSTTSSKAVTVRFQDVGLPPTATVGVTYVYESVIKQATGDVVCDLVGSSAEFMVFAPVGMQAESCVQ